MSTPIQLKITQIGLESIFQAESRGLKLQLDRIAYSSANFESVNMDPRTELSNIIHKSGIVTGGVSEDRQTLRFMSVINVPEEIEVKSLGVYTEDNVLFAVASVPAGNLFKVYGGISFVASFGLAVAASSSSIINITTDQNAAMSLVLMLDHERAVNPHPQYLAAVRRVEQMILDVEQRIHGVENRPSDEIKVGDLFLTTLHFADGDAVAAHKGYGRWRRFGDGQVLATQALDTNNEAPAFFKNLKATGGAYTHKLTVAEMPKHKHSTAPYDKFSARSSDAGDQNASGHDWANAYWEYSSLLNTEAKWNTATEKERGGDQPHNNVQPSIVIAAWERLPDNPTTYELTADKTIVNEGDTVVFTLQTTNVPQGTSVRARFNITPSMQIVPDNQIQNFIIGADGKATISYKVYNITESDQVDVSLSLPDHGVDVWLIVMPSNQAPGPVDDFVLRVVTLNGEGGIESIIHQELRETVILPWNLIGNARGVVYPILRSQAHLLAPYQDATDIIDTVIDGRLLRSLAYGEMIMPFSFYNTPSTPFQAPILQHYYGIGTPTKLTADFTFKHKTAGDISVTLTTSYNVSTEPGDYILKVSQFDANMQPVRTLYNEMLLRPDMFGKKGLAAIPLVPGHYFQFYPILRNEINLGSDMPIFNIQQCHVNGIDLDNIVDGRTVAHFQYKKLPEIAAFKVPLAKISNTPESGTNKVSNFVFKHAIRGNISLDIYASDQWGEFSL